MERQPHNNPWADKLLQVSLPDSGEAWTAMEAVLDREMPLRRGRDRRRWLLLLLFLLLLIGVCNCPGRGRLFRSYSTERRDGGTRGTADARGSTGAQGSAGVTVFANTEGSAGSHGLVASAARSPVAMGGPRVPADAWTSTDARVSSAHAGGPVGNGVRVVLGKKKTDSLQKKKPAVPPEEKDEKEKEHGWMIGAGLNQFFPIGGQRGSTYNSDGLTGTLNDYLPVPMIRYYFNHRLYIQLEAQLNTPQPTKKNLVFNAPLPDTNSIRGTTIVSSASIQQLYYFNIPVSIHYALSDRLNVGAGLQLSHLSNAIGNFDSTITNGNTANTTDAKVTKSFKGDTLFHRIKTNELRFLVDVNYTYKRFIVGVRYNQALSNFIDLRLPAGQTTAARNSSFQLYLRYIFFDSRKKKDASAGRKSGGTASR